MLSDVVVAYETWGRLDADAANAVLVCHAWTGDSHAAGPAGRGHTRAGMVGRHDRAGQADRHRQVLRRLRQRARRLPGLDRAGVAASARRSRRTGRASRSSRSATWCAPSRDSPNTSGSTRWLSVIGGSMGGMQAIEWAVMYPASRALARGDRHVHAGDGATDRVGRDRSAGDPSRSGVARWRLLRRRAGRRARTRASRSPAWSPR